MDTVRNWIESFSRALDEGAPEGIAAHFAEHGLWRDFLAFDWTLATHEGRAAIASFAAARLAPTAARSWKPEGDGNGSEGFFSFETASGLAKGYVRLVDGAALTLFTMLYELHGHEFPMGRRRPNGCETDALGRNAYEQVAEDKATIGIGRQPYVLVVGAGQAGLAIGATLRLLNVPHLLIDKHPRVGDQWRSRYKSLTLHDPVWYDHMPYLPFPDHWPAYTPKDRMGDWLEHYAAIMDVNVWTETELVEARRDDAAGTWRAVVRRDGETIELAPAQLVMAVGNAGFPIVPQIEGQDVFRGQQRHSSEHPGGEGLAGKRVVVIGANNSAHDICADLVDHGALPTMVQRSSTHIIRQSTMAEVMMRPLFSQEAVEEGVTTEIADMMVASIPLRLMEIGAREMWTQLRERDKEFYAALENAGFRLDFAEDGAGISAKYLRSASGYYIDVGASAMVADGRIALKTGTEIARLTETGVAFADGSHLDADIIIYATGFGAMEQWVARLIGQDVADRIGRCWGYGSGFKGDPGPWEGELRNMWKPTSQEGLWFMGGNLSQARFYSRLLGLQLKARYEGLVPDQPAD